MEPMASPPTEADAGLLPALPPLETLVEWATVTTLGIGVVGVLVLVLAWWVLWHRAENLHWVKAAQWLNRMALLGWFSGLLVAVAAPPFLVVVIPGIVLHVMALSRLSRIRMKLEAPPYPRLQLVYSAPGESADSPG